MASYLMYIKTRMLLSKAEQEEAQSEYGCKPRRIPAEAAAAADAYQQIQKRAKQLGTRNELGLGLLTKRPGAPGQPDQTQCYW